MIFFPFSGLSDRPGLGCSWKPEAFSKIEKELVKVTPAPVFSWLEGLNDGMLGGVEMFGGMLILRIVAAADMTTDETDTQMHPGITYFQAILAAIGAGGDLTYLVKMTTLFCHCARFPFSLSSMTSRVMKRMTGSPPCPSRLEISANTSANHKFGQQGCVRTKLWSF
jgi:hypothetical protein